MTHEMSACNLQCTIGTPYLIVVINRVDSENYDKVGLGRFQKAKGKSKSELSQFSPAYQFHLTLNELVVTGPR